MQNPPKKKTKRRKSRVALWIALGLMLLLSAAFVLVLPQIRAAFPSPKTHIVVDVQTQRVFHTTEAENLESLTITPEKGES